MTTAVLERETEIRSEWNHSCTAQCPQPCPYSNTLDVPEVMTMGQEQG
jgi:hypothetical protein